MKYKNQVLLNTVANVFYLVVQWAFTVITTRLVSVEMAGVLAFAISVTNIIYTIQYYGMRNYQVSDAKGEFTPEQYIAVRRTTIVAGLLLCVGYLAVCGFTAEKTAIIFLYVLFRTAEAMSDVYFGEMQKMDRLDLTAWSMMGKSAVLLVVFFVLTWLTRGILIPLAAISAISMGVTFLVDGKNYRRLTGAPREKVPMAKQIKPLRVGLAMMLSILFPIVVTSLPRMTLDRFYGAELLGHYGNVAMPTTLIVAIVPNVLTPIMSLYGQWISQREYSKLFRAYLLTLAGTCGIGLVCIAGVWLLGEPVMTLIYSREILPYIHYLYPLIGTTTLYAFTMCNNSLLISLRSNSIVWISAAASNAVCAVGCWMLIEPMGIPGVILTMGISYGLQIMIQWIAVLRQYRKRKNATNEERKKV